MDKYFIITNSDGDTHVECVTKEVLLERINDEHYGSFPNYMNELPKDSDTNYWGGDIMIIKGELVSPEIKTKITEFTIN
jgi:hypothetical protein